MPERRSRRRQRKKTKVKEEYIMKHEFKQIEPKWQKRWEDAKAFRTPDTLKGPKFYGLVEFPYPSGAGMHVGHIKAYSGLEVISRKRRMQGYNVLFPMGFDAFGLPTENYAIKHNRQRKLRISSRFRILIRRFRIVFSGVRVCCPLLFLLIVRSCFCQSKKAVFPVDGSRRS